jgi:hypothetical protein
MQPGLFNTYDSRTLIVLSDLQPEDALALAHRQGVDAAARTKFAGQR